MPNLPSRPNVPSMGSLQQRAASLQADAEAAAKRAGQQESSSNRQSSEQTPADPYSESPGPVGAGDYVVRDGDCVCSIAKTTGHFWEKIWDDPANREVHDVRQDPNVLLPGDRLTIPPLTPKDEPGQTEMRHRFRRRGEPSFLRMRVLVDDTPRGNEKYVLTIDSAIEKTGTTDPNGFLEIPIPGTARTGVLKVGEGEDQLVYELKLGCANPVTDIGGIQQRLTNLGHYRGPIDGVLNPRTKMALSCFQDKMGLPQTGEPDKATQDRLKLEHGS